MRITREDVEKLSKKKQEEFKFRIGKVKEIPFLCLGLTYLRWLIYIFAFFIIALPLWKLAFPLTAFVALSNVFYILVKFFVWIIIFGFILYYILFLYNIHKINSIKKEYFSVKIEPKK